MLGGMVDAASDAAVETPDDASTEAPDDAPDDAPVDAHSGRKPRPVPSIPEMMAQAQAQMKTACAGLMKSGQMDAVPPMMVVMCWCNLGDVAHAKAAYAKLAPSARQPVRAICQQAGVPLP